MKKQSAFTLIEIMVVVVILGILATLVIPKVIDRPDQAKKVKAKQDIQAIENAVEMYKLDNGFYPSTDQGVKALVVKPASSPIPNQWKTGGYLKKQPKDPWERPYLYLNPGEHSEIDVFTLGADGQEGGEGINSTIGNWDVDEDTAN